MKTQPVLFTTRTKYSLPAQRFMIPVEWKRFQLSQLINKALSLTQPIPFDFLIRGELLRASLGGWCAEHAVAEEETLEVEYIESVLPPQKLSDFPHDDWVTSVSCQLPGHILTASYDGSIRAIAYSQKTVANVAIHSAAVTSVVHVPKTVPVDEDQIMVATGSQDHTGRIARLNLKPDSEEKVDILASLHLHTAPISSISASSSGNHLLTASWDGLIGLWSSEIPENDEVADVSGHGRTKRRKLSIKKEPGKRKGPTMILKSHTGRVTQAVFASSDRAAVSCGFDSSIRQWDTEKGICTLTIPAAEKPFLDLAYTGDQSTAFASSTDRTVTAYDLRVDAKTSSSAVVASFPHPATPSCVAVGSVSHQVASGSYDGVVRLWDLRSTKGAIAAFKIWSGTQKILAIDWKSDMIAAGGEGMEIWKVSQAQHT